MAEVGEVGAVAPAGISDEDWRTWLELARVLVAEHHLDPRTPEGRRRLVEEAERFFATRAVRTTPPPDDAPG